MPHLGFKSESGLSKFLFFFFFFLYNKIFMAKTDGCVATGTKFTCFDEVTRGLTRE